MKKFIRFVLVLIGIAILLVLVLGVIEPKEVTVSRAIIIKAPRDIVFNQVVKFKNWPNWSPWYKMDSGKMKLTYNGTDGTEGSSYHWEGTENTGAGDIRNTGVNGTTMNLEMDLIRPYNFSLPGIFKAVDTANMTKVTWSHTVKMSFPLNATFVLMNWDKLLGSDFESGLANLKQFIEGHSLPIPNIEVKEVDYPAHIFEGIRKTISWNDLPKFFNDAYSIVAGDVGSKVNGHQQGIFFTWDTINKQTDAMAAFPVEDTTMQVVGTTFLHAGPARACMAVQKGGYSTSVQYHSAIMKYMVAKNLNHGLVIEEYITGPKQETDSNKWVTNIYYLVQ